MAHGSYSDHLLLSKAYSGWLEALSSGTDYEYVRDSFLHRGTLKMIQGLPVSLRVWCVCVCVCACTGDQCDIISSIQSPLLLPSLPPSLPPPLPSSSLPFPTHYIGMRDQFLSHLQSLGLSKLSSCDTHSHNRGMLRGVLTAGLYPNVMRMAKMLESAGGVKSGGKKRVRNGFKTRSVVLNCSSTAFGLMFVLFVCVLRACLQPRWTGDDSSFLRES